MATPAWIGAATPVADVWTLTLGGTWEVGDIINLTIGTKTWSYAVTSTVIATITAALDEAWDALSSSAYPEFAEYTATNTATTVIFTADTAGIPGTISVATTEAGGGAADAQTVSISNTTPGTGPNSWDNAANWSTGVIPADTDTVSIQNSAVDILYGLNQSSIQPTLLAIYSTFTGKIGLPRTNAAGRYPEYRPQYLQIGPTTTRIGIGAGGGSGRIKIDFGSDQTSVEVTGSGQPIETGLESILLKGSHADNAITATKGSIGLAVLANETATWKTIKIGYQTSIPSDVKMRIGSGVTANGAGSTLVKEGGELVTSASLLTVTQAAGTMTIDGSATVSSLTNRTGATVYDLSTGTITTLDNAGTYDHTRLPKAKTITNCTVRKGHKTLDPSGTITWTNPVQFVGITQDKADGEFNFGYNRKLTVADI